MIEIVIKKNGIQTNGARFNSQQEADAWLEQEISKNSFGKNERWVTEGQEDISNAIESRTIEIFPAQEEILDEELNIIQEARAAVTRTEYKLAAEYVIEQPDLTNEIRLNKLNEIRSIRSPKLSELDLMINIAVVEAWTAAERLPLKDYRVALLDMTEPYKLDMSLLDNLDIAAIEWPIKPE